MPDAATAARQAELEKRHRDLTKPVDPIGSTGESLRSVKGFDGITDEMLAERQNFNLRDHLAGKPQAIAVASRTIDLKTMTREELLGLADAALTQASMTPEPEKT